MAKRKPNYRSYGDQEKAEALACLESNGGNLQRTSRQLGIPRKTLEQWRNGLHLHKGVAEISREKVGSLANAAEILAWRIVESLPEKIAEASLKNAATAFGIMIDKMLLLQGRATTITGQEKDSMDILTQLYDLGRKYGIEVNNGSAHVPIGYNGVSSELVSGVGEDVTARSKEVEAGPGQSHRPIPSGPGGGNDLGGNEAGPLAGGAAPLF